MNSIWNTNPLWLAGFASSAAQFAADFKQTYCISHIEEDGLVTIGSKEWDDYSVSSTAYFSLHKSGGLVIRSVGHKRYYGAVLENGKEAVLYVQKDGMRKELARTAYTYQEDLPYQMKLTAKGSELYFEVNGTLLLQTEDETYHCGGTGFVISKGTMTCDSLIIEGV